MTIIDGHQNKHTSWARNKFVVYNSDVWNASRVIVIVVSHNDDSSSNVAQMSWTYLLRVLKVLTLFLPRVLYHTIILS